MKILLIIYNSAIEDEVMEIIAKQNVSKYTKFQNVLGRGGHSDPHLDTPIWPGVNSVLLIAIEETMLGKLIKELKSLKGRFEKAGLKALVFPVEEIF